MPIDQPPSITAPSHYVIQAYPRHNGFAQTSPLTAEEQKYDDTAREIDKTTNSIGARSASQFTAKELMWFSNYTNKLQIGPTQKQLDHQLKLLKELEQVLEQRATNTGTINMSPEELARALKDPSLLYWSR